MASDVRLIVVDPEGGAVMVSAWIGMSRSIDRLRQVLRREPETSFRGYECWGSVEPFEALAVAETHYVKGATPDDVRRWSAQYPTPRYWWILEHDC